MSEFGKEGIYFSMTHPMQEGWLERGLGRMPDVAQNKIRERYDNSEVNPDSVIQTLSMMTANATIVRHTEELANLGVLGIANTLTQPVSGEKATERSNYLSRAGNPEDVIDQIDWYAKAAASALTSARDNGSTVTKILAEIGGTRQYGLWKYNGTSTTQQLDAVIEAIPDQIIKRFKGAKVHHYRYEGATPVRYRVDVPMTSFGQILFGRRRRATDDALIQTPDGEIKLEFIKQFRGLAILPFIERSYADILSEEFTIQPGDKDFEQKTRRINNALGNVMREAIRQKGTEPLSVCPVDTHLLVRATI